MKLDSDEANEAKLTCAYGALMSLQQSSNLTSANDALQSFTWLASSEGVSDGTQENFTKKRTKFAALSC